MSQGLSTPDSSLSPTHLSIRRGRATTTHYTHHQVSLVVSRNTTLVPSLWLRIGPACGPQRWHAKGACVTPNKKEKKNFPRSVATNLKQTLKTGTNQDS